MIKVYGITQCDTVKKALNWLKQNNVSYEFHDYKKHGVTEAKLKEWIHLTDWETLVNKRGTTWKKLSPEIQSGITSSKNAIALMLEKNSVIKRPLIEYNKGILIGFDELQYQEAFL